MEANTHASSVHMLGITFVDGPEQGQVTIFAHDKVGTLLQQTTLSRDAARATYWAILKLIEQRA